MLTITTPETKDRSFRLAVIDSDTVIVTNGYYVVKTSPDLVTIAGGRQPFPGQAFQGGYAKPIEDGDAGLVEAFKAVVTQTLTPGQPELHPLEIGPGLGNIYIHDRHYVSSSKMTDRTIAVYYGPTGQLYLVDQAVLDKVTACIAGTIRLVSHNHNSNKAIHIYSAGEPVGAIMPIRSTDLPGLASLASLIPTTD